MQLEVEPPLLSGCARLRVPRRLVRRSGKMGVALAATPSTRNDHPLTGYAQVSQELARFGIGDDGAGRDTHFRVLAALAILLFAAPMLTPAAFDQRMELEIQKGREPGVHNEHDVTAVAAVAAIGATVRLVFLTQKADTPAPPVAGTDVDLGFIDELHRRCWRRLATTGRKRKFRCPSGWGWKSETGLEVVFLGREDMHLAAVLAYPLVANDAVDFR